MTFETLFSGLKKPFILIFAAILILGFAAIPASQILADSDDSDSSSDDDDDNERGIQEYYSWGYRTAIGGFSIDAENVLRNASREEIASLNAELKASLSEVPADLQKASPLRKISLKRLSALLQDSAQNNQPIPDAALYMGGLTRIDYVVAVPEENDIYLAGPAEGWTVDESGVVVGQESGRPILHLEDFLNVFRSWNTQTPEVITCSIDPTPEAISQLVQLGPEASEAQRTEAMGLMNVSFTGIPAESRLARVLAAADYRLKTISLGYEELKMKHFPSYFSMLKKGSRSESFGQRFWLSPEYKTLYHDSDSLAWRLGDSTVAAYTEREHLQKDGSRQTTVKKDLNAQKWAKSMSERYDEVSKEIPVFAEAKNGMEIALTVALIYYEGLAEKSGCSLETFQNSDLVKLPSYNVTAKVPGFALTRVLDNRGSSVSVTGGISINPWAALEQKTENDLSLNDLSSKIAFTGNNWWAD